MSVGAELAAARQSLGLSLDDVSTRTKISVERLSAIEQMDVAQLPSLVYLKGFLRAYAAEVQLDPDDIAERYLSEVEITPPEPSALTSVPATVAVDECVIERADDWQAEFASENAPDGALPLSAPEPATRIASTGKYFAVMDPRDASPSPPVSRRSSVRYLPVAIVLVIAGIAGWALSANLDKIAGGFTRGRVAATDAGPSDAPRASDQARASVPEPVPPAVPANARPAEANTEPSAKSDALPANSARESNVDANRAGAPANVDAVGKAESTVANEKETAAPSAAAATEPVAGASPDLTGAWALTNRVESSSFEPFNNLNLGFHLQLQQRGNRVTGTGQKWMENGRAIPTRSRTPITVEGTLTGRRLELTFTERGTRRANAGTFVMDLEDDGTLRGTFASDAAKAQGTSLARRMESR